jgi:two-component system, OmpR family, sensor histidine kinase SenX3
MAPLLITVAILQYQWARELSASAETQIDSNLDALMTRWVLDLHDQLSAPCMALQVGPDAGEHDSWGDYLDRYIKWSGVAAAEKNENASRSSQLVTDVYVWESSGETTPQLWRFEASQKKIAKSTAPHELIPLLNRLRGKSSSLPSAVNAWRAEGAALGRSVDDQYRAMSGWQFDPDVPAFAHPIVHHGRPLDSQTPVNRGAVDWIIVVLDNAAIRNSLLPELATRYFGAPNGLEYKVTVTANGKSNPTVLYASDPVNVADLASFSTRMNIFDATDRESKHPQNPSSDQRSVKGETWRDLYASVSFPVMQSRSEYTGWTLMLQPKNGAVNTMANSFWRRDLVLGGLLLLMLVANMMLVVFATHRADRFARLQMEFIASVSHELRTPLAAILSAGENLKDGFIPSQNSLAFYGSLITSKSRQLIQLVDRILLFASTLSGKTQYVVRPLSVADIFQALRKDTAGLLESLGYTIEQHIEPGLPPVVGDLSGTVACLQNFVTNATKYGGQDRWVGLSATRHPAGKAEEIQLSVQDHGQGIANADLTHIFQAFYRSPAAVSAQIPGTGLGLAVANNIAEAMGGRISVRTAVGVGTTFVLHLPAAVEPEPRLDSSKLATEAATKNE